MCQGIACFFGHLGFLLKFSGKEKKIYIIYIRKTKHSEAKKIKKKKKAWIISMNYFLLRYKYSDKLIK